LLSRINGTNCKKNNNFFVDYVFEKSLFFITIKNKKVMNQPLAYVHPGAKIAKNVVIEPFTTIHNNVVMVMELGLVQM
jgi:UDP-3-O-[3-hydroxymyristoyl] glucosamine N-acyltransferase